MDYDVIIIGSGAGGGTLAYALAGTGKQILILERGGWMPREKENWDPKEVFVNSRYVSPDMWYSHGKPFQPQTHYYVGGATKMYGAALYRLRPEDFGTVQHIDGISPGWPLSYDEFEPWYSQAEQLYQVHGNIGEDPTEGYHSMPYPWPAVSHETRISQLAGDLARHGYHPFHSPCGILLDEKQPQESKCLRCATCVGHPCIVQAKADAETIAVRPALQHPNVTLITNAEVDHLTSRDRKVTGVSAYVNGEKVMFTAGVVVVSAGAVNTAKILLNSNIGNSSDQVGRNYMFHNSRAVMALSRTPNGTVYQKTLGVNDFYFPTDDFPYPMGNIQMLGKSNAEAMRGESPGKTMFAPESLLSRVAGHSVDFWLTTEDLPLPGNRVTLGADGAVNLAYRPTNSQESLMLYRQLRMMLRRLGMFETASMTVPVAGVAHQAGTTRFGVDPATSVLDVNCKVHDLDNLYVVDAGFMPSVGAVNPALTVIANALRVGGHLRTVL